MPNFYSEADQVVFEFFYWFSRFEHALMQNRFVQEGAPCGAMADWDLFVGAHRHGYVMNASARQLREAPPLRQVVVADRTVHWAPLALDDCTSDLAVAALLVRTMRNNLFHGGRDGPEGWSQPARMLELLLVGVAMLDDFARLAGIEVCYEGS